MYFSFTNGNSSAFENSLDSGYPQFLKRPCRGAAHKDNAVGKRGSGDGQRLWDYGATVRSVNAVSALCLVVERRGSTLTCTVCKAIGGSAPITKSGKCVWRAYLRTTLDCEKTVVLCFLPPWSTLLFERGLGEEGEIWRGSPQWTTKSQLPKPQTATAAAAQRPK